MLNAVLEYEAGRHQSSDAVAVIDATGHDSYPEGKQALGGDERVFFSEFPSLSRAPRWISLKQIEVPDGIRLISQQLFETFGRHRPQRFNFENEVDVNFLSLEAPHIAIDGETALVRATWQNSWNDCGTSSLILATKNGEQWSVVGHVGPIILW